MFMDDVISKLSEAGEFYSAKEVTKVFVKNKVRTYRTKTILDKAVDDGKLSRVFSKRTWWYGRRIDKTLEV